MRTRQNATKFNQPHFPPTAKDEFMQKMVCKRHVIISSHFFLVNYLFRKQLKLFIGSSRHVYLVISFLYMYVLGILYVFHMTAASNFEQFFFGKISQQKKNAFHWSINAAHYLVIMVFFYYVVVLEYFNFVVTTNVLNMKRKMVLFKMY